MYASAAGQTGFVAPVPISEALTRTVRYEFVESHEGEDIFNSE
jgi:hypothetical protein